MTIEEAVQRGNNLIGVALVALPGVAFVPEFFFEDEASHRVDEVGLFVLALVGVAWFLAGNNKLRRSIVPLLLLCGDLVFKIVAVVLERGDADDLMDDGFFALIFFGLAILLVGWLYISSRRGMESSGS